MKIINRVNNYSEFYESIDREKIYSSGLNLEQDLFYRELVENFVKKFSLEDKKLLEIGSGNGRYQDVVRDYIGIDIAASLRKYYHKPYFIIGPEKPYPFPNEHFDGIFTRSTFEHIPNINFALKEMVRVLKKGGYIFFHMAWYVRPWTAKGYHVRPYSDFDFKGKIIKTSVPLRENLIFRSIFIFPKRITQLLGFILNKKNFKDNLKYKKLKANYEIFWCSDSDACNSVDPFAMILYFMANNCKVINYSNLLKSFFVRSGNLIIYKR